jgi:hypothetical protein
MGPAARRLVASLSAACAACSALIGVDYTPVDDAAGGGAGQDAHTSTLDGRIGREDAGDASSSGEAGPETGGNDAADDATCAPGTGPGVSCNGKRCDSFCCKEGTVETCIVDAAGCAVSPTFVIQCDESSDCPPKQVCCGKILGLSALSTFCADTCTGTPICQTSCECANHDCTACEAGTYAYGGCGGCPQK